MKAAPANVDGSMRPAYRTNAYVWGVRFIQILFALIIVGFTGSAISDWHSIGCSSPSRLSFNFAVALLSMFVILYLIFSSGPYMKHPYYSLYATLILEALFILLYIIAAALSTYDCSGLCKACSSAGAQIDEGAGFHVWVNSLICDCWFSDDEVPFSVKRDAPSKIFTRGGGKPASSGRSGSGTGARLGKTVEKGFSSATKKGLDATMIILFLISLATVLYMRYSKKSERQAKVNGEYQAQEMGERVDGAVNLGPKENGPSVTEVI